jgi:hypothetical protein
LTLGEPIVAPSLEQVQRWVKDWIVGVDPEVEVQVLPARDDPREKGEIIPVRFARHGYRLTVAFPERSLPGSPLPEGTCRTLEQVIRLLRSMEARHLPRAWDAVVDNLRDRE